MTAPRSRLAPAPATQARLGPPAAAPWRPLPRPAARVGYGLPVLAAVAASLTWFTPGRYIATGDIAPFIRTNLAGEATAAWNHQVTGAGSASYTITQLPEVLLLRAAGLLGLPGPAAQLILYALVAAAAAFGTAYLAGTWLRRPGPVAAAGLVGLFNAYTLVNVPNLLPLLAIALTGLLCGTVLRAAAGAPISPRRLALLTLPVGYLAQNPPLVLTVAAAVAAATAAGSWLTGPGGTRRAARFTARAAAPAAAVNLYWAVPYLLTLTGGAGLAFTAQTDVGAWAWTQVRAGLGNVLALNTHWGWHDPSYFPYAAAMDHGPAELARWLLPGLAWAGLLLAHPRPGPGRRPLWTLAGAGLALVWLAKGLHPPLGGVNGWLYGHLPGMWLLRDPMSKLGALLVPIYAVGVAHAIDAAIARLRALPARRWRHAGQLAAVVVVAGAVAYPWPLYTGAAVPGARGYLPSDRVAVPAAWHAAARYVNALPGTGKTVVLPLDPYYQVTTNWGYHGVDAIPAQLLHRPVLQELPGGYFTATAGVTALLDGTQTALLTGDTAAVPQRLRALGVATIIVRHDLTASPDLPAPADPGLLTAALAHTPGVSLAARYPVADIYRLTDAGLITAATGLLGVHADAPDGVSAAVGALPAATTLSTDDHMPLSGFSWQVDQAGSQTFTLAAAGTYQLRAAATAQATFHAQTDPRHARVLLTDADTVTLDGQPLPARPPIGVPVSDPRVAGLDIDGTLIPLPAAGANLTLPAAGTITAYAPAGPPTPLTARFGPLGDCNRIDPRSPAQAGLALTHPVAGVLQLSAAAHTACTAAGLAPPAGALVVEVSFDYRTLTGAPARACLWQTGVDRCASQPAPPPSGGRWAHYTGLARLDPAGTGLRLYLYADGDDGQPATTVQYRAIHLTALHAVGAAAVTVGPAPAQHRQLTAGAHTVTFTTRAPQPQIASYSPLADCNNSRGRTAQAAGLTARHHPDGTVQLTARTDTACVTAQPAITNPGSLYRLHLDYRTLAGRPARICLWETGPNTCAATPPLAADPSWRSLATTVHIDPGTRQLQLYLYADGQTNPTTQVAYRNITVRRAAPTTILITPIAAAAPTPPTITVTHATATAVTVRLTGLHARANLVLAESYAPGWTLTGLPPGWHAQHFPANGYANGWLLHGTGNATLHLHYRPQQWATLAAWLSLLTLLAIAGYAAAPAARHVRQRLVNLTHRATLPPRTDPAVDRAGRHRHFPRTRRRPPEDPT